MTAPAPGLRRRLLSWLLVALALAAVVAGLLYGVEHLVWDVSAQSYAYEERPGAAAVALVGAALAGGLVVAARRVGRRGLTHRSPGR